MAIPDFSFGGWLTHVVGFGGHGDEVSDVVEVVAFKAAKDPVKYQNTKLFWVKKTSWKIKVFANLKIVIYLDFYWTPKSSGPHLNSLPSITSMPRLLRPFRLKNFLAVFLFLWLCQNESQTLIFRTLTCRGLQLRSYVLHPQQMLMIWFWKVIFNDLSFLNLYSIKLYQIIFMITV